MLQILPAGKQPLACRIILHLANIVNENLLNCVIVVAFTGLLQREPHTAGLTCPSVCIIVTGMKCGIG